MQKGAIYSLCFLLLFGFVFSFAVGDVMAQANDPNIHGTKFVHKSRQVMATGCQKDYVLVDFLGDFFDVNIKPLDGGKAIMVNNLNYDKGLKTYKGKLFVKADDFLKFFDVKYNRQSTYVFHILSTGIPMFDSAVQRVEKGAKVTVGKASHNCEVILVGGQRYAPLEDIVRLAGASADMSQKSQGIIKLNGKIVDRWMLRGGKVYVLISDVAKALKKNIQ